MNLSQFKFFLPLQVRFAETDLQGHVFFGNYLIYFDEAMNGLLHALGCPYDDLRAVGADLVYIHAECDYHSRAFFEDTLQVYSRVAGLGNSSVTFECAAVRARGDELVATGKLVAVTVDPETKKTIRVPEIFRRAVEKFQGSEV